MEHVSHFTYGWINPAIGFGFAFAGSFIALICMSQARKNRLNRQRTRWITFASLALGGTGIWMMHFTAMIGFSVTISEVAYDPWITALSLVVSIGSVAFGLFVVGYGERSVWKVFLGGPLTGLGVVSMHYSGMAAVNISGTITHDSTYFWASIVIAVVAATVALSFGTWLTNRIWQMVAAALMAVAISGMHYTGMAGAEVTIHNDGMDPVSGIHPVMLVLPILVVATFIIIALLFGMMHRGTRGPNADTNSWDLNEMPLDARPSSGNYQAERPEVPMQATGDSEPAPRPAPSPHQHQHQPPQQHAAPAPAARPQPQQPQSGVWAPGYEAPAPRPRSERLQKDPADETFHFLREISRQHPTVSENYRHDVPLPPYQSPTSSGR